MTFEEKKNKALAIMAQKKMRHSNYALWVHRLLWKAGLKLPPPPFSPFWLNVLVSAVTFGMIFLLLTLLMNWRTAGSEWQTLVMDSVKSGLIYGVLDGLYQSWSRKVNQLPSWENLP